MGTTSSLQIHNFLEWGPDPKEICIPLKKKKKLQII